MTCTKGAATAKGYGRGKMSEAPAIFDSVADHYDADFTNTLLGRMLRRRVWSVLGRQFMAGDRVLELACGTGEDAVWLAKRGVRVTAIDGSAEMVRLAQEKVARYGLAGRVEVGQRSLEEVAGDKGQGAEGRWHGAGGRERVAGGKGQVAGSEWQFDGVFGNFGGLNAIGDWRPLAASLAGVVRAGGRLALTVMGPFCPWEIGWHLAHGRAGMAFRRFGGRSTAKVGRNNMSVWYPTPGRLKRDFSPWFRFVSLESLGLWLPPTYLGHLVERWPSPFSSLDHLERITARLTRGWGDHFVIVFGRNDKA